MTATQKKQSTKAWLYVGAIIIATITIGVWGFIALTGYALYRYSKNTQ